MKDKVKYVLKKEAMPVFTLVKSEIDSIKDLRLLGFHTYVQRHLDEGTLTYPQIMEDLEISSLEIKELTDALINRGLIHDVS